MTIYVPLLHNGVEVLHPIQSEWLGGHRYRVLGEGPANLNWPFRPGTVVIGAKADCIKAVVDEGGDEAFWAEHDPYGERFGSRISFWGCFAIIFTLAVVLYLIVR